MSFTYKGLKATLERHIVTDAEVDRQIERLQQQNPRIAEITDRATQNGDEVVLDYAGFCDGEQFAGGTAEKQTLVLGSGQFIPGFEEQLLDKVPGEEVVVKVTFPVQYHAENLAGKEAEFRCKLHAIRVKTPYELDDTFAKEVGGCETFEQMRQKVAESLQSYIDERGEMDLQDRLLRMAADTLNFQPSEKQMQAEMGEMKKEIDSLGAKIAASRLDSILASAKTVGAFRLITADLGEMQADAARTLADEIKARYDDAVAVLSVGDASKFNFLAVAGKAAVAGGAHAGKLVGAVAAVTGGKGGGRPDNAMAGGKDADKIAEALASAEGILSSMLK